MVDPQVLEYAHATAYIQAFINGDLGDDAMRRIGLPWNEAFGDRSLATMGEAVAAAEYALENGLSGQLAGEPTTPTGILEPGFASSTILPSSL